VVARGTEEALETLETAISRGPLGARVDGVDKSVVSHEIVLPKPFDIK
jgi:acylphosphatase